MLEEYKVRKSKLKIVIVWIVKEIYAYYSSNKDTIAKQRLLKLINLKFTKWNTKKRHENSDLTVK